MTSSTRIWTLPFISRCLWSNKWLKTGWCSIYLLIYLLIYWFVWLFFSYVVRGSSIQIAGLSVGVSFFCLLVCVFVFLLCYLLTYLSHSLQRIGICGFIYIYVFMYVYLLFIYMYVCIHMYIYYVCTFLRSMRVLFILHTIYTYIRLYIHI